ncbi:MAG: AAA family ATPase [Deltaproteobacteria bacterium]|nr:AAA family ATPase [Deltaproteobacteria bacterium]
MKPEAVILIGIQATGKSTFYKERFFCTHVRINLDMLRTRHREKLLLAACLEGRVSFVVDNTSPTTRDRARYIPAAKAAGFRIIGFLFESEVRSAVDRNAQRPEDERVPEAAIWGTASKLERPSLSEGFDELHNVRIADGRFVVEEWREQRTKPFR